MHAQRLNDDLNCPISFIAMMIAVRFLVWESSVRAQIVGTILTTTPFNLDGDRSSTGLSQLPSATTPRQENSRRREKSSGFQNRVTDATPRRPVNSVESVTSRRALDSYPLREVKTYLH